MTASSKEPGTVYLVGAGPGHPGLITRWGFDLLNLCDAVAYDALIPMELISGLPERVEKYYVGKRSGKHSLPQSQINALLVSLARRGLNVVRLKGGDPFVFGRIGEEAAHLSAAEIPVVMVPGVTAASAAAAMSGFSLTSRQESSWIFIATGHPAENTNTPVPWDRVAALPGGTLVIYMGIARLERIVEQLVASGMAPDTPSVVVQAASTGLQRSVRASLRDISAECRRQKLQPPALVIIGDSVHCRFDNSGAAARSLAGKRVLLTGPPQTTGSICAALREAGAEPMPYPTVACREFDDAAGWRRFLENTGQGGVCFFRNGSDVGRFFLQCRRRRRDIRTFARFKFIAEGEGAEAVLREHGILADAIIGEAGFRSLEESLARLVPSAELPLVLVHGHSAPDIPEENIRAKCSGILRLKVETESVLDWDARWKDDLCSEPPDFIVFTGAMEVPAYVEILGSDGAAGMARGSCVVAMDAAVPDALGMYGLPCAIQANASDIGGLVRAMAGYSGGRTGK